MADRLRFFVSVLILISLSGCGYVLQGSGSVLPADVRRIHIPIAENSTPETGLGLTVTEALRDQFERYGVLFVVEELSEADAVLNCRIMSVNRESRTVTSTTDTDLQLETQLILAAELRRVTGPVLWSNNRIQISQAFGTTQDVVVTSSADFASGGLSSADIGGLDSRELSRGQEAEVLEQLAEDAARRIYNEAVLPEF